MNRLFFLVIFYCFCLNTKFICTFENIIENYNIRFINFNKAIEEEWLNVNSKELVNFENNENNENRIYFVYRAAASKEDFEQVLGKEEFYYNIIVFPVKGNSFKSSIEEEVRASFFDSFANIYNRGKKDYEDYLNILEKRRDPLLTCEKKIYFFFIPVSQDESIEENSFLLSCLYSEKKDLFFADDIVLTVYSTFYQASKKSSLCASIKEIIRKEFFKKEEEDKSYSCCPCCNFF